MPYLKNGNSIQYTTAIAQYSPELWCGSGTALRYEYLTYHSPYSAQNQLPVSSGCATRENGKKINIRKSLQLF